MLLETNDWSNVDPRGIEPLSVRCHRTVTTGELRAQRDHFNSS